jgi:cell division protein FtsA
MSKENVITAIDIGSDKIATLIATYGGDSPRLRVVGFSAVSSLGVQKSAIVNLEAALGAIEESLNAAERMAGISVRSAYVLVSGSHVSSKNSTGVVAVADPDQEITEEDVERVIEAARAISVPAEREVIHVVPRFFKVDSQEGIKDPVGMTGVRLEAEAHIITGLSSTLKNIRKCLSDLGIDVEAFVFSALAAAEVTLTETEKELGAVALNIGSDTSSFCAYVDGVLELSGSLPIGAKHITQDIALGSRIDRESAEKIKQHLSNTKDAKLKPMPGESKKDFSLRVKAADIIDVEKLGISEVKEELTRTFVIKTIMHPRMKEIVTLLGEKLDRENLFSEVPAGLIISGGGAQTVDLIEVSERALGLPARIGNPPELEGIMTEIKTPGFAAAVGLLVYGQKQGAGETVSHKIKLGEVFRDLKIKNFSKKIIGFLQNLLP